MAEQQKSEGVAALTRGLEILRCFSAREPRLSNSELAARTGLPRSTVSRLTKTLVEHGYLRHNPRQRQYSVGPSVLALGYSALSNLRVADIARPHMQALAESTGALISLATRDRLSMLYLEACSSDTLLTLRMGRGVRMPILPTSIGRAFLAGLPEKERGYLVEQLRQKNDPVLSDEDLQKLEREIQRYEEEGVCLSLGDWNADVNAAATTVRWPGANELIVISISGPSFLTTEAVLKETWVPRLKQLAQHIAKQLSSFAVS